MDLKFFISGTLVASAQDIYYNGELVQTEGTNYAQNNGSGSVAGVVLYDEGVVVLTGQLGLTEQLLILEISQDKELGKILRLEQMMETLMLVTIGKLFF